MCEDKGVLGQKERGVILLFPILLQSLPTPLTTYCN